MISVRQPDYKRTDPTRDCHGKPVQLFACLSQPVQTYAQRWRTIDQGGLVSRQHQNDESDRRYHLAPSLLSPGEMRFRAAAFPPPFLSRLRDSQWIQQSQFEPLLHFPAKVLPTKLLQT